jgi:hypothetical protein
MLSGFAVQRERRRITSTLRPSSSSFAALAGGLGEFSVAAVETLLFLGGMVGGERQAAYAPAIDCGRDEALRRCTQSLNVNA